MSDGLKFPEETTFTSDMPYVACHMADGTTYTIRDNVSEFPPLTIPSLQRALLITRLRWIADHLEELPEVTPWA